MLTSVITQLSALAGAALGAAGEVVTLWPVAVMAAFMVIGIATGFITRLAGAKGRKRRAR